MRLKYNILWFEDNKRYYEIASKDIHEYLEEQGYVPDLERRSDDTNLIEKMEEKDVDLILVDYNLKDKLKGDELVTTVRKNELYTEAIFYAQNPPDLSRIKGQYEGVFYTTRKNLIEKTKKIIDLTIKKNQDFSNIRGLFIAETVDMTKQIEQMISKILQLENEQLDFFMDEIAQLPEFTDTSKFKIINRFFKSTIKSLHEKYEAMPSGKKRDQLMTRISNIKKTKSMFCNYANEVIEIRNALAHGKPSGKKNCLIWKNKERL
ncbi:MAG: hypothetical protein OEW75_16995, partial [Cyclobacteriaceae bacterium]|nr:hypothetical protein [Cyclobacteriaceae bacterium]